MEIRFETTLSDDPCSHIDEWRGECNPPPGSSIEQEDAADIDTDVFWHASELYKQKCRGNYYLVCYPTSTGRIALLDEEAADLLERFRFPASLSAFYFGEEIPEKVRTAVSLFYQLGFLKNGARNSVNHTDTTAKTLSAWLHITNACNLHCDYCYVDKSSESMTDDTTRKAIDAIFRSAIKHRFRKIQLRYAGGEASLQSERVIALHDYAQTLAQRYNIDLHASILSNGVFLSARTIDRLKDRNIAVMISLDGVGSYHDSQRPFISGRGSFRLVDRTIAQLLAKGLVPHISVTVSLRNLAGLPELISYILERNLTFSLNYYRDNNCSSHIRDLQFTDQQMIDAMRSVFALIERKLPQRSLLGSLIDKADLRYTHQSTCGVGDSYLVIDQRGGVAKCHADIKRTITTIAVDDPIQIIRDDRQGVQASSIDEKEGCRSCSWRHWCTGGCPLLTYRSTGRSDVKSPNCNIYKALFPHVLHLEALRLLKYVQPYTLSYPQAEDRQNTNLFYV